MGMAASDCQHHAAYMKLALREALKAKGRTSPNPLVGAVIVTGKTIVGKGFHQKAGTPHAEIYAFAQAGERASGATLYVTLEPCNHHGRTPPCTHAVLQAGIQKVVVGMTDPNPLVSGKGIAFLQSHGVEVVTGILEKECRRINYPFLKWIETGLPWVILKAGVSLDGKIATAKGHSNWITNEKSRRIVHHLRDQVDAILIGVDTALHDDPSLTTRLPGKGHRDPVRVVLDTNLRLPVTARLITQDSAAATLIFCRSDCDEQRKQKLQQAGAVVVPVTLGVDGQIDLKVVLSELGSREMTSILVEGGGKVHGAFLRHRLVDQVQLFYGPCFLGGDGISLAADLGVAKVDSAPRLLAVNSRRIGDNVLIEGYMNKEMLE